MGASHTAREDHVSATPPTALLVVNGVAIELRRTLLAARRSPSEQLLERVPLSVLTILSRDIVGRLARVTAHRTLLQTVGAAGYAPEFTITDAAPRLLARQLLTARRNAITLALANPTGDSYGSCSPRGTQSRSSGQLTTTEARAGVGVGPRIYPIADERLLEFQQLPQKLALASGSSARIWQPGLSRESDPDDHLLGALRGAPRELSVSVVLCPSFEVCCSGRACRQASYT